MSRKQKITEVDADKVRQQAADLGHVLSDQATKAGELAAALAEQGKVWATDVAGPRIDKAWRDGVKIAAPKVEAAAQKARPAVDAAHDRIVDDYLPRVQKAMHDAAEAASGKGSVKDKAGKAGKAAQKALTTKPKRGRGKKAFGWILVGTAAAGTGYLLWRRTQPVDDPGGHHGDHPHRADHCSGGRGRRAGRRRRCRRLRGGRGRRCHRAGDRHQGLTAECPGPTGPGHCAV